MRRRLRGGSVGIGALVFVVGCGASAKSGGASHEARVTESSASPATTASPTAGDSTKAAEDDEAEKQRNLQEQLHESKEQTEKEELLRKLQEQEQQKANGEKADGKSKGDKPACECVPGDPLCSCMPGQGGRAKKKASVHAASTTSMSGRLSPEQVESAVAQQIDVFAACTKDDVTVSLKALITEKGVVAKVSAGKSQPDLARLRECVANAFKTIQFPASSDGKSVPIEFDLVLSPSS